MRFQERCLSNYYLVYLCKKIMLKRWLTKEEKLELFKMYNTYKYSTEDLSKVFNKSVSSIRCLLHRNGIKGRNKYASKRKYPINKYFFDTINCENNAYFLGILYADGCNHFGITRVTLNLKEDDKEILIKLNNLLQPTRPLAFVKSTKKNWKNQYSIIVQNTRISENLNKLGCIPRKTFTLKFPTDEQVPEHLMSHFMRGFFDGDGYISNNSSSITASRLFCTGFSKFLSNKFGFTGRIRQKQGAVEQVFKKKETEIILNWTYKDASLYMKRKHNSYTKYYK